MRQYGKSHSRRSDCQRSGASRANLGRYPSPDKVAALHDQFGINAGESAQEVARIADIIFAAVKPGIMIKVLSEITSSLNKDSLVVSIAAGVTLDQLARALGHDRKIIRAMPNTPALVNAGMTSVTPNALVTPEDTADVLIFSAALAKRK
ncbi:pyrroline-5-carboxylate reductase family protein [Shigella flexneri]